MLLMTCLVINKKCLPQTFVATKIKMPVKGEETKRKMVECNVQCVKRSPNLLLVSMCVCPLCNRYGRKKVFFLTTILQALTALLQAASTGWLMFSLLNLLRGCSQNYSVSHVLGKARGPSDPVVLPTSSSQLPLMFLFRVGAAGPVFQGHLLLDWPLCRLCRWLRHVAPPRLLHSQLEDAAGCVRRPQRVAPSSVVVSLRWQTVFFSALWWNFTAL